MDESAQKKRNEYQRNWNKKNKEKIKKYQENYWLKKAERQQ